jgi:hypothetical protein
MGVGKAPVGKPKAPQCGEGTGLGPSITKGISYPVG